MSEQDINARVTRLETLLEQVALRPWVHDLFGPLKESLIKVEAAILRVTENQERADERQTELYNLHSSLLKERAERERDEYEARIKALQESTFLKKLTRAAPAFSIATACLTLLTAAVAALIWVIQHAPSK